MSDRSEQWAEHKALSSSGLKTSKKNPIGYRSDPEGAAADEAAGGETSVSVLDRDRAPDFVHLTYEDQSQTNYSAQYSVASASPDVSDAESRGRSSRVSIAERDSVRAHMEKVERLRREKEMKEIEQCTFKPTLVTRKRNEKMKMSGNLDVLGGGSEDSVKPIYERLYALKDKLPDSIALEKHRRSGDAELDECTFAPALGPPVPKLPAPVFLEGSESDLSRLAAVANVQLTEDGEILFVGSAGRRGASTARRENQPKTVSAGPREAVSDAAAASVVAGDIKTTADSKGGTTPDAPRSEHSNGIINHKVATSLASAGGAPQFRLPPPPRRLHSRSPSKEYRRVDSAEKLHALRPATEGGGPEGNAVGDGAADQSNNERVMMIGRTFNDFESEINNFAVQMKILPASSARGAGAKEAEEKRNEPKTKMRTGERPLDEAHTAAVEVAPVVDRAGSGVPAVPKGFELAVAKMRLSRERRVRKEKELEDLGTFSEERYQKSRKLAAEGIKPFAFKTDDRLRKNHTAAELEAAVGHSRKPRFVFMLF